MIVAKKYEPNLPEFYLLGICPSLNITKIFYSLVFRVN